MKELNQKILTKWSNSGLADIKDEAWKILEQLTKGMNTLQKEILQAKVVDTSAQAWDIQERYTGKPHGWVQWKGTNVCMNIRCKCGELTHIDADFCYHVKCVCCGAVYMVNGHVEFIELKNPEPDLLVITSNND